LGKKGERGIKGIRSEMTNVKIQITNEIQSSKSKCQILAFELCHLTFEIVFI